MKRFNLMAASFVFAAIAAASGFAQTPATPAQAKIVVINSAAFAAKDGITKYAKAIDALEIEFKPTQDEINKMATRYQTLASEVESARKAATPAAGVPAKAPDPTVLQAKVDEAQSLELRIKRAQEDGKARYEKREAAVLEPIMSDIMKGLDEFAKQKGYALILDAAKLVSAGVILALDTSKVDVTKEFITFYNARPGATATTAAPPR
jgi:Skp family chaperone for outer membrane proteins